MTYRWEFGPNVSTFRCYRSAKLSEHMHKLLAVDVDGLTSVTFEKIFERLLASRGVSTHRIRILREVSESGCRLSVRGE